MWPLGLSAFRWLQSIVFSNSSAKLVQSEHKSKFIYSFLPENSPISCTLAFVLAGRGWDAGDGASHSVAVGHRCRLHTSRSVHAGSPVGCRCRHGSLKCMVLRFFSPKKQCRNLGCGIADGGCYPIRTDDLIPVKDAL